MNGPTVLMEAYLKKILKNLYLILRERERERASRGGTETEGDTESEAASTEPDAGLEPMNCDLS